MGMVVRSNIMALNANRQLGMNNSAVSKSLEKLSSGFKINRAGDDASGLAISEKMKAQIKGLETASANSQDGISLVQTAEGALTEVHDMLNRMVELAEKAANGTMETPVGGGVYGDAGTDRNAIQDEMDALATEIDRIADSTNFNNIKLLDGSLSEKVASPSGGTTTSAYGVMSLADAPRPVASGTPNVSYVSGTAGVPVSGSGKAAIFEMDLSSVAVSGNSASAGTLALQIGDKTVNIAVSGAMSGATLAAAITTALGTGSVQINGVDYKVSVSGNSLLFTADQKGAVSGSIGFSVASGSGMTVSAGLPATASVVQTGANVVMSGAMGGKTNFEFTNALTPSDGDVMTVGGKQFVFVAASGSNVSLASGQVAITIPASGGAASLAAAVSTAIGNAGISGVSSVSVSGGQISITSTSASPITVTFGVDSSSGVTYAPPALGTGTVKAGTKVEMDFNDIVSNTNANFGTGTILNINGKFYEFVTSGGVAAATAGDSATDTIKVNLGTNAEESLKNLAKAITDKDGSIEASYADGKMTLKATKELPSAPQWEMVNAGSGTITANDFQSPYTNAEVIDPNKGGLVLQIGDTNDSFNKLTVSIDDMHMSNLFSDTGVTGLQTHAIGGSGGVVTLDISNQENAGHALTAIKKAINSVSTQRAKLGAVQNRLEHTINNLDVAAENMSAANSRIRDTDMAKQMMDYTKMNVLTQAAQAMLAQANQQPQSVLQLLQ